MLNTKKKTLLDGGEAEVDPTRKGGVFFCVSAAALSRGGEICSSFVANLFLGVGGRRGAGGGFHLEAPGRRAGSPPCLTCGTDVQTQPRSPEATPPARHWCQTLA
jgi:hypothetical protein